MEVVKKIQQPNIRLANSYAKPLQVIISVKEAILAAEGVLTFLTGYYICLFLMERYLKELIFLVFMNLTFTCRHCIKNVKFEYVESKICMGRTFFFFVHD